MPRAPKIKPRGRHPTMEEAGWIKEIIEGYAPNPDFDRPGRYERELYEYVMKKLVEKYNVKTKDVYENFNFESFIKKRIRLLRGTPDIDLARAHGKHIKKYGQRNRGIAETPEERVAFLTIGPQVTPFQPSGTGFENVGTMSSPPASTSSEYHLGPYSGDFQLFYKTTALVPRPPLPLAPLFGGPAPTNPTKHPITGPQKIIPEQKITKERVEEWALMALTEVNRGESQGQVMGCSARDAILAANYGLTYTDSCGDKADWECEWLHLVAYSLGGIDNSPQQADNLVAGLAESNSAMISIEDAVKHIVTTRDQNLYISVTATCILNTHVAQSIVYEIRKNPRPKGKGPDWVYTVQFNPLWPNDQVKGDTSLLTSAILEALQLSSKSPIGLTS